MKNIKALLPTMLLSLFTSMALTAHAEETDPNNLYAIKSITSHDAKIVSTFYKDLDEDGVQDKLDHCPNTLPGAPVDAYGCELDSDSDGVFDRLDQCPDSAPGVKVNVFGCEGDEDGDGIYDSKDQCPGTPPNTTVDEVGCKTIGDHDKDGINDVDDQCPTTPLGATVNTHGCQPVIAVLTNIVFDSNSHAVRADQEPILKHDAGTLSDLKEGQIVLITGHTDYQGSRSMNERLSWRRANSTKDFIIAELGHSADRVYITGKGELEPIADNTTAEGRQKNRRIELKIISLDELPEGAVLTMPAKMALK
ncbi:MAG: OmpA family protein [Gammaproteobacteria bacterium]|nr:OmpA family protein [Gammaproteobacteria bacterium]